MKLNLNIDYLDDLHAYHYTPYIFTPLPLSTQQQLHDIT
jgi:hypothetical protein